ncbi:MAG: regulatory protein [Enterobacterales bacterium]|jgi:regulatory protein
MTDDGAKLRSKLRKSMMGLLARREHSRLELYQKMQLRGFESALINTNLDDFTDHDWQSDERYSKMLLRSRILKCHGPVKIAMELQHKGLSSNIIERCLAKEINWTALAIDALKKKYSQPPVDQNQRNKHYRFLVQRGFTSEQVKLAMNHQKTQ